jgi:tRNA isopentenyl-2-thiomethyl-A-37 hydroxylase MiaE
MKKTEAVRRTMRPLTVFGNDRSSQLRRFKVLSKKHKDPELAKFYHDLMISEAGHYTTFLGFAKNMQTI